MNPSSRRGVSRTNNTPNDATRGLRGSGTESHRTHTERCQTRSSVLDSGKVDSNSRSTNETVHSLDYTDVRGNRSQTWYRPKTNTKGPKSRASLCIGSLNINGGGIASSSKWGQLNGMIHRKGLNILGLQETHLTHEQCTQLNSQFRNLLILNSPDPEHTSSRGV